MPRVAPPAVAQAVPARQPHAPSGIAFFVSGMYRGNRGTWTAIIEGRDAIRPHGRTALPDLRGAHVRTSVSNLRGASASSCAARIARRCAVHSMRGE
ncbi:hypothetical protein DB771_05455 [Burkholderia sp. AU29985]|nr:hypothetical protein EGY28_08660 [Burkholderia dolosa]PRE49784.1 hypothetical protein C6P87_12450 [Burkholderia sp. AU12872]PUA77901.1 hypothetical protein DB771_05455 [Burkholderia sp. AU29985]